jgi:hypothetical protein
MRSGKPKDFRSTPTATGARPTPAVYRSLMAAVRACRQAYARKRVAEQPFRSEPIEILTQMAPSLGTDAD